MLGFRALTYHPAHRSITTSLGYGSNPRITQSQLITKSTGKGSAIVPHQDACVTFTYPLSCLTYGYALEDCIIENGCSEVARGSHLIKALKHSSVKGERVEPKTVELEKLI